MKAKQFWNNRAAGYDASVQGKYVEAYRKTVEISREYLDKNTRLLDYGCGTGIITNQIAPDVGSVTAVDISENMIAIARQKAAQLNLSNVTYLAAKLTDERIQSGSYDVISTFNLLYFIEDLEGLLRKIHEMLPQGGYFLSVTDCLGEKVMLKSLIISVMMKMKLLPFMRLLSTKQLVKAIEEAGFEVVRVENLFDSPPNLYIAAQKRK
jgi:2-polyprenyl-3-methyl-5-hydroxy-6-metoxy-1,4-benzoquinol methylase